MAQLLNCSLCGMEFQKTETVCVQGCPVKGACSYVRCPHCSYEMPETPRFIERLRSMWHRTVNGNGRRFAEPSDATHCSQGDALTLDSLRTGERATVSSIGSASNGRRNTLGIFGMAPGTEITLLQRRPACVVRVGETELGLDPAIAREIHVVRCAEA